MFSVTFKEVFRQMILSYEKGWRRRRGRRGARWEGKEEVGSNDGLYNFHYLKQM